MAGLSPGSSDPGVLWHCLGLMVVHVLRQSYLYGGRNPRLPECRDSQAWSTALDSGSSRAGVRRFKSGSLHTVITGFFLSGGFWYRPLFRMSGIVGLFEKTKSVVGAYTCVVDLGRARGLVSECSRHRVGTTAPIDAHLPERCT